MDTHRISKNTAFDGYWVSFLRSHNDPVNRACHYVGTGLLLSGIVFGLLSADMLLAVVICLIGYSLTVCGHFVYEQNLPYMARPLWNLVCDILMLYLFIFDNKKLKQQLERIDS